MRDPALDAKVAAALEHAHQHLGFLHRLGALKEDKIKDPMRERARLELANPQFGLSDDVRDYLLQLLSENEEAAARPRKGAPAKKKRDYWIMQMVARLANAYSLTPTRNRGNNPGHQRLTACEIVTRVLGENGINLSGASIEVMWSRRRLEDVEFDELPLSFDLPPEYLDRLDEQLIARKRERMKARPALPVQQKS
jgi:hypothetical protein